MDFPNIIQYSVLLIPIYLIFKEKIDSFIKGLFSKASAVGMPVTNDLSEPAKHFKNVCIYDNESINAAMAVAKALGEGSEQDDFIQNTVPFLIKRSLKEKDE